MGPLFDERDGPDLPIGWVYDVDSKRANLSSALCNSTVEWSGLRRAAGSALLSIHRDHPTGLHQGQKQQETDHHAVDESAQQTR